jgi:hypothetical protein
MHSKMQYYILYLTAIMQYCIMVLHVQRTKQNKRATGIQKGFYEVPARKSPPLLSGVPSSMVEQAPSDRRMWIRFPRDTPTKTSAPRQFASGHGAISSGMSRYQPKRTIGSRP